MMTIEKAKELWRKNKDRHIYDVVWKGNECIHIYKAFHFYVIYDGKIVSKHKIYKHAVKSKSRNSMYIIKNAYELFGAMDIK